MFPDSSHSWPIILFTFRGETKVIDQKEVNMELEEGRVEKQSIN